MTTATAPSRTAVRTHGSTDAVARRPFVPLRALVEPPPDRQPIDLELLSAHWQQALDAAGSALRAAGDSLAAPELHERQAALVRETERTNVALRALAQSGRQPAPWLSPTPVTNTMLGLPATVRACLFDVEGVLTDSSRLHAWAWGKCSTTSCPDWARPRDGTSSRSTAWRTIALTSRGAPGSRA